MPEGRRAVSGEEDTGAAMVKTSIAISTSIVILALATGCTSAPVRDFCLLASPIEPEMADVDVLSDHLVGQILEHNETWAKLCD